MRRLLLAALPAIPAAAQCNPQWLPADGYPYPFISIRSAIAAWDPDGLGPLGPCVTVGSFGGTTDPGAYWDGRAWRTFPMGNHPSIWAMGTYAGDLICAGGASGFYSYGGGSVSGSIARFDGTRYYALGTGAPMTSILGICEWNGSLYTASGTTAGGLHRWDGAAWTTLPDPPTVSFPRAWCVHNGQLVVAGSGATRVATWDGATWTPWPVTPPLTQIECVASWNGQLVVGSQFAYFFNGQTWQQTSAPDIRGLLTLGSTLYSVGSSVVSRWLPPQGWLPIGPALNSSVLAIGTGPAGTFVVGGFSAGGGYAQLLGIARYSSGTLLPIGVSSPSTRAIAVGDPDIYTASGTSVLHYDGGTWTGYPALSATVRALILDGNSIIAGGDFTAGIRRWDGSAVWQTLGGGVTTAQGTLSVQALARHGPDLYAGGKFDAAGPTAALNIARWDGAAWHALASGVNDAVLAATSFNGDLILGGLFTGAGAVAADHVARWDGQSFFPMGAGFNGEVDALAVHDGALYAGGYFTASGATTVNRIARWDGHTWQPLDAGVTAAGVITLASVGSELLVGGTFMNVNGQPASFLAHWGCPGAICYANCDHSTAAPALNIQDFACFLNRLASGDTWANCDNSSFPPALNVQDFSCFLNKFAGGCT